MITAEFQKGFVTILGGAEPALLEMVDSDTWELLCDLRVVRLVKPTTYEIALEPIEGGSYVYRKNGYYYFPVGNSVWFCPEALESIFGGVPDKIYYKLIHAAPGRTSSSG